MIKFLHNYTTTTLLLLLLHYFYDTNTPTTPLYLYYNLIIPLLQQLIQ